MRGLGLCLKDFFVIRFFDFYIVDVLGRLVVGLFCAW